LKFLHIVLKTLEKIEGTFAETLATLSTQNRTKTNNTKPRKLKRWVTRIPLKPGWTQVLVKG